jgi:hypothetical protein
MSNFQLKDVLSRAIESFSFAEEIICCYRTLGQFTSSEKSATGPYSEPLQYCSLSKNPFRYKNVISLSHPRVFSTKLSLSTTLFHEKFRTFLVVDEWKIIKFLFMYFFTSLLIKLFDVQLFFSAISFRNPLM